MSEEGLPRISTDAAWQGQAERLAMERNVEEIQRETKKSVKPQLNSRSRPQSMHDVKLLFQVDPNSNEITIVILDRTSQKVIRTIPPEYMKEMSEGELVHLFT